MYKTAFQHGAVWQCVGLPWDALSEKLEKLNTALNANDIHAVRSMLQELVPGYTPESDIVDWVWMENARAA